MRPEGDGYRTSHWQGVFLASRAGTIYSGTSEEATAAIANGLERMSEHAGWVVQIGHPADRLVDEREPDLLVGRHGSEG